MSSDITTAPPTSTKVETLGIRMRIGRGATDKFLSFDLNGQAHAIPILKVKEIIRMMRITPLPHAAGYVRGIINLRGKVIPVLDMRAKFGFPPVDDSKRTCIVVVQVQKKDSLWHVGLVVDHVNEVLNVPADAIEGTPDLGYDQQHLQGVGKIADKVVLIVDIEGIVGEDHNIV